MDHPVPVRFSSVCVVVMCVFGAARATGGECYCSEIPKRNLTRPPLETCSGVKSSFRYTCVDGYTRKAGTSTLIRCLNNNGLQWSSSNLECIPDPKLPPKSSAKPKITTQASNISGTSTSRQSEKTSVPSTERPNISGLTQQGVNKNSTQCSRAENSSPSAMNNVSSQTEANKAATAQRVGVSLLVVVLVCAVICIAFLLYQRRNARPLQTGEEMEHMNEGPGMELDNS